MEESIKRKERLNAMRMEASEDGVGYGGGNSSIVSQSLANPLIETNSSSSMGSEPHAAPRFDYYTDPLAAFSANKRGSKVSHQISPDFTTHPSPANPGFISPTAQQSNSTPDLRPFQAQGPYYSPGPFRSPGPMGIPNPYNDPRGIISHWGRPGGSSPNANPGGSSPNFFPNANPGGSSLNFFPNANPGGSSPNFFLNANPGGSSPNFFPNANPGGSSPNFFPSANPGFGQGNRPGFNYGQGRGYRFDNSPQAGSGFRGSPYHNSGRGRSSGLGSSGSSSFKQSGSHNAVSAEFRPDRYYKKSMVEDPWKRLKPVLWKQTNFGSSSTNLDGSNSWLPKSIGSKKPRVSVTPDKNKSGQSLAEYLAASFNEATNETDDDDDRLNV